MSLTRINVLAAAGMLIAGVGVLFWDSGYGVGRVIGGLLMFIGTVCAVGFGALWWSRWLGRRSTNR